MASSSEDAPMSIDFATQRYQRYAESLSAGELERELGYAEERISGTPMHAALQAEAERRA
jgi:hypothetical protein